MDLPALAPDLMSDDLRVTQLHEGYFAEYCQLVADPVSRHWTVTSAAFSDQQLMSWLTSRPGQTNRLDWAIVDNATSLLLGEIVLNELDPSLKSMNLRIALLSKYIGLGLGTKAVRLVADYAFKVLGLREIRLDVWTENQTAIRVYEKVGFVARSKIVQDGKEFLIMSFENPFK